MKKNKKKHGFISSAFLFCLPFIFIALSYFAFQYAVNSGLIKAWVSYVDSEKEASETTHDTIYKYLVDKAERANHVSNRGSLNLGNLKETAKLEVFRASDTEYVIRKNDKNVKNYSYFA